MYGDFSAEVCTHDILEECRDDITYTKSPNTLFNLTSADEYREFLSNVTKVMAGCSINDCWIRSTTCRLMYPKCTTELEQQLCRNSCLGDYQKYISEVNWMCLTILHVYKI